MTTTQKKELKEIINQYLKVNAILINRMDTLTNSVNDYKETSILSRLLITSEQLSKCKETTIDILTDVYRGANLVK